MTGAIAGILFGICITAGEVSPAVEKIGDAALSAPPELAADILLRLCESGKVKDRKKRAQWIDTAFQLAAVAKFAYPKRGAVARASTDSDSGML